MIMEKSIGLTFALVIAYMSQSFIPTGLVVASGEEVNHSRQTRQRLPEHALSKEVIIDRGLMRHICAL